MKAQTLPHLPREHPQAMESAATYYAARFANGGFVPLLHGHHTFQVTPEDRRAFPELASVSEVHVSLEAAGYVLVSPLMEGCEACRDPHLPMA